MPDDCGAPAFAFPYRRGSMRDGRIRVVGEDCWGVTVFFYDSKGIRRKTQADGVQP
jgi:hypothetical protein